MEQGATRATSISGDWLCCLRRSRRRAPLLEHGAQRRPRGDCCSFVRWIGEPMDRSSSCLCSLRSTRTMEASRIRRSVRSRRKLCAARTQIEMFVCGGRSLTFFSALYCALLFSPGWVGMYGTITGYSESNLAVSEKVWDAYKGLDNILGYPWTFMLQDILRFDIDVDTAIARIGQSARTCSIWLGIGQGARPNPYLSNATLPPKFHIVADSFQELHIYTPENGPIYANHDYFPDLIFVNKHVQPSGEACMNDLFHWGWGQLQAESFYTTITALEQTGDMHIAVTDFDSKTFTVSNAHPLPNNTPAYNNGFVQFDMVAMWNEQPPTIEEVKMSELRNGKVQLE